MNPTTMPRVDVADLLAKRAHPFWSSLPPFLSRRVVAVLENLFRIYHINEFLQSKATVVGIDLIDEIFEEIDFSYVLASRELERIPSHGRVVCVSNHPLGGLDGLVTLRTIGQVRTDVVVVANDVLNSLPGIREFLIPVDVFRPGATRIQLDDIGKSLEQEKAVVFFPAGEVSRPTLTGINDAVWSKGAVRFAQKYHAPILPLHIDGRNSILFYAISILFKSASKFLLPREMFNKRGRRVHVRIGELIPYDSFSAIHAKPATRLVRKQVDALAAGRKGPFRTESGIALSVERRLLRKEIEACQELGSPSPGKQLFLADARMAANIVREIARLREVTFRSVGEGTGRRLDLDQYDATYKHLFLWDEARLEIAGAYRLGFCGDLIRKHGIEGLYTHSLFEFSPELSFLLPYSVELGRSFVQKQYWNSSTLEFLWAGIGTILSQFGGMRYLFGPVSISKNYLPPDQAAIVYVYNKWFGADDPLVRSRSKYQPPRELSRHLRDYFCGKDLHEDLNRLKMRLRSHGTSVPMLFRQYTELCSREGVRVHDFGVDVGFSSCIDAFIMLDLAYLEESKRERYITKYSHTLRYCMAPRTQSGTQSLRHALHQALRQTHL